MLANLHRYASAFADVMANRHLDRHRTTAELTVFAELIEGSRELRTIWLNPSVPGVQKRKVLDWIAARIGADQMVRNLVAVLIARHHVSSLRELIDELEHELNKRAGLAEAAVTTARILTASEKRELEAQMEALLNTHVLARYTVEPKLLGGAVIKSGSSVYDGSLRRQFAVMKAQLIGS